MEQRSAELIIDPRSRKYLYIYRPRTLSSLRTDFFAVDLLRGIVNLRRCGTPHPKRLHSPTSSLTHATSTPSPFAPHVHYLSITATKNTHLPAYECDINLQYSMQVQVPSNPRRVPYICGFRIRRYVEPASGKCLLQQLQVLSRRSNHATLFSGTALFQRVVL